MKKKLFVAISAIVCLLASVFGLTACNGNNGIKVKDITLAVNEAKQIEVYFNGSSETEVTYTFEGENIVIENGFAAGLVADTVTTVTAKAGNEETTFKVTVGSETAETDFSIDDIELKKNAKRIIAIDASVAVQKSVTFRYEGNDIKIDKNAAGAYYVEGLAAGTVTTVTAVSNKSVVRFTVTVSEDFTETVTIDDVTLNVGETETIVPVFSDETKKEELNYKFSGNSITVTDGVITAVKEGTTEVTAYSKNYSVKFTVTVTAPFTVENAETFEGYFMTVKPTFSGEATEVTYTSDSENIEITGYNIKGITKGTATVTATNGSYTTTFTVKVKASSEATDNGKARPLSEENLRLNAVKEGLKSFDYEENELVLFAGDSFMDERWFFVDFYSLSRYGAKNAYTVGISSSRASAWKYLMQNFYSYQPKAIVLHIGTNDLFDGGLSSDVILENLYTLLSMSNENMPNTHIYWWTIEQRIGYANYNPIIKQINSAMATYAEDKTWLDVIDTYSALSDENGNPISNLYGKNGSSGNDTIHPACPEGYDKLLDLTYKAGLKITENSKSAYLCEHDYEESWSWNGESATLTLVCTKNNSHKLTSSDVTYTVKADENDKWGIEAAATLNETGYTDFKAYEAIYSDLVIASTESVSGSRNLKNTSGKFYFSAKVDVTGITAENNVYLQFGKNKDKLRFLAWAKAEQTNLILYNFYYCDTAYGLVEVTDGAANFTVEVTANGYTAWFKVNGTIVATINENNDIKNWNDLFIGGENANWSFSDVIYESEGGEHYKETPDNSEDYSKINAGEKVALSNINEDFTDAKYAEVTVYGNSFDSSVFSIGTSLVVTDSEGNSVYGFGSWEYSNMGWLLAWQDVTQDNAKHNDEMWQWMTKLNSETFRSFCDYTLGLKISVAIYGGKLYAFYSVDGGTNWIKFVPNGSRDINTYVTPAKIGYIYAGHDAYYKNLSASTTVPEKITAIINKEFETQSYGNANSAGYTAIDFNVNGYVESDFVASFNVENASVTNYLTYTAYNAEGSYGHGASWSGTWSLFHKAGKMEDGYASLYAGKLSDSNFTMTANYTVTIVRYLGTMYTIIKTADGTTYAKAAIADSVTKIAFGGYSEKSTATLTNKKVSYSTEDITAALEGILSEE